jgi:2-amino-4-hydroxy-6-hydroxymethyldihydropteridine diphosphokinase
MNPLSAASPSPHYPVFVALGSNLGDSRVILTAAMAELGRLSAIPLRCSSLWRSDPVDCPPESPSFLNAAVALLPHAGETPESLLAKLQVIERKFGRQPKKAPNESRPLDLDLVAWANEVRCTPILVLPHPRAHERRFVLQPLAEIAPDLRLPGQIKTVAELLAGLPDVPVVTRA